MNTTPSELDPYASWDAAYVLGSLPASERHDYEQHVAGCRRCRDRLAELSGLPGLLALVGPDTLDPNGPVSLPNPAPYAVFARKARRRRAGHAVAAAAAVLALVGGTAAVTASLQPAAAPPAAQATGTPARAAVQLAFTSTGQRLLAAHGQVTPEPWGTLLAWTCSYSAAGAEPDSAGYGNTAVPGVYELVVVTTAGQHVSVATWQAGPGSTVSPVATTTIPVGSIRELLIQEQAGAGPSTGPLLRAML
jgi:anti-sigma factor RsiW